MLNNSTEITMTNTSTAATISVLAQILTQGTHTIKVLLYFTNQIVEKEATFTVVVNPCKCTVSMTPITGYSNSYNLTTTPPAYQEKTTTITQANSVCGYSPTLSYSVNNSAYSQFLSISITNNNKVGLTFSQTNTRALAGTYIITLTASVDISRYPTATITNATQTLTITVYDQCQLSVVT